MKIAIAQINTRAGDFEHTGDRMIALSESASEQGAEVVVFPMATLTGQQPVDYANIEGYAADLWTTLQRLAQTVACPCVVPVVAQMDGEPYHEVMLVQNGKVVPLRLRTYLQREAEGTQGAMQNHSTIFELGKKSIALAQTYEDLDELIDMSAEVDVVLFVSDYGYALDDAGAALGAALLESRYKADAVALDAWFVAAGSVGGYGLQVYAGSSFVLSPSGSLVASASAFEEALLVADMPMNARQEDEQANADALEPEIYNRTLHLWQALSLGLCDYFFKQGQTEAVVALDGTLASCLLAVLATDALGPTHVHAVIGGFAKAELDGLARNLASALRIEVLPSAMRFDAQMDERLLADVLQVELAHAARSVAGVPLHHADKTYLSLEVRQNECKVAQLLPFGDVYRTDLVSLAHLRNTISPIIPARAFHYVEVPCVEGLEDAEPTPELRLKRIDVTLSNHIEWERPLSDVVARQGEALVCSDILRKFEQACTLRASWPPCIVVSSRPLYAVHIPFGHAWRDRIRTQDERVAASQAAENRISELRKAEGQSAPVPQRSEMPGLEELMKGLELEFRGGGIVQGEGDESLESAVNELLGLLQDISQEGGNPSIEGPFGPLTWGSPFSEN